MRLSDPKIGSKVWVLVSSAAGNSQAFFL